jgi:hypothetical protein
MQASETACFLTRPVSSWLVRSLTESRVANGLPIWANLPARECPTGRARPASSSNTRGRTTPATCARVSRSRSATSASISSSLRSSGFTLGRLRTATGKPRLRPGLSWPGALKGKGRWLDQTARSWTTELGRGHSVVVEQAPADAVAVEGALGERLRVEAQSSRTS